LEVCGTGLLPVHTFVAESTRRQGGAPAEPRVNGAIRNHKGALAERRRHAEFDAALPTHITAEGRSRHASLACFENRQWPTGAKNALAKRFFVSG